MHAKALADAKAESAKVTQEASQDSERITAQLAEQAGTEAERIKAQGIQQIQLMRQQLIRQLRTGLGSESVAKADALVRAHVADPAAQAATVDRFLAELEQMAPSSVMIDTAATAKLRARQPRVAVGPGRQVRLHRERSGRRRPDHAGRRADIGGQAAAVRSRC